MSLVGVMGILVGLLAWRIAMIEPTRVRIAVFVLAYLMHVLAGFAFYFYSLTNISDSNSYYYDDYGFAASEGFGLTTQLIYYMVYVGRTVFGGTFLDYFLVFQAFGFFGIAYLMRIFEEIYRELDVPQPTYIYLLLFLPGMHFWTSSIGKDGIIFTGICMSLWATMQIRRRFAWFAFGVFLVLVIRPHVALILGAAVAAAIFFEKSTSWARRVALIGAAVVAISISASSVETRFTLDVTSADSVSEFLATHDRVVTTTQEGPIVSGSLPYRFFSLMVRPMFIDADGWFGLIASFENLALLFIVGVLLRRSGTIVQMVRSLTFIRYALIMAAGIALLLSLIYYNVGLGLRQRMMFVPGLLVPFVVLLALQRARRLHAPSRVDVDAPAPSGSRGVVAPRALR
jgi:hypothetical protein